MTTYQWVTLGLGALGFLATWILGAFKLGRVVEQMRAAIKKEIDNERDKLVSKLEELEEKFEQDQRMQDHNFGEVGAAMRQYIADVEKKVREVEIWGRDNYVQKGEFEKATDSIRSDIRAMGADIKSDFRDRIDGLSKRIEKSGT
jgi:NAD-dependent DNA ligase